ncbi:MAG: hypothetical protein R2863_00890 [Candidatus Kapaibacterium sp.]|nr:hypothetical protein [Ignavibacteriota bacterium]MCB9220208.1 hypothetical protein [Ignavibacteria bacterium]
MNRISKYLNSFAIVSILLWIGSSVIRSSIGFSLFKVKDQFTMRNNIDMSELYYTINTYINITFYVDLFYLLSLLFITLLLIFNFKYLKKYGWLFISIVLFYIFSIPELYLILNDVDLYYYNLKSINNTISNGSLHLFKQRFILDTFKIIQPMSFLSHLAIAFFMILKPLEKK